MKTFLWVKYKEKFETMWWSAAKIAKICSVDQFYYITPEHMKNGWFKIYNFDQIRVTDKSVWTMPESGEFVAVPREVIDKINPQCDFTIKTRISVDGKTFNFGEFLMGDVFDENTWKWSKELSWALISSNEPCIDMGDWLWINSSSCKVPKFECKEVCEMFCKCMNDAISRYNRYGGQDFTIEDKEKNVSVRITICISEGLREILGSKNVGRLNLPQKQEDISTDNE